MPDLIVAVPTEAPVTAVMTSPVQVGVVEAVVVQGPPGAPGARGDPGPAGPPGGVASVNGIIPAPVSGDVPVTVALTRAAFDLIAVPTPGVTYLIEN